MTIQLLLVEPDQAVRDELRAHLQKHQVEMSVLYDATSLVRRLELEVPSAIVLRHGLPAIDGMAALRRVREAGFDMPVIIVSRSAEVIDKILAFELGADDYMVDPFDPHELVARVRNSLRRRNQESSATPVYRERFRFGDCELDFLGRRLFRNGSEVRLRASEFALLKIFATHPMKTLSRARIIGMLGRTGTGEAERGLDVLVFRLRAALQTSPSGRQYIQTLRGRGYIFVPDDKVAELQIEDDIEADHEPFAMPRRVVRYDAVVQ
ncbi:response regulator [Paraburkholderia phosphatilytica]|uniref:response regulator n=1 Tax=Paraburkholderia phosphatilytica TaxID=2282883 RepID=UPI000E506513|nr:response regulator transcription factor [Paraburkholderia phosphatilytica]